MIVKNNPNAAKLISSLRNTGYSSYAAVEDIIDNSIDAGAREIKVVVNIVGKEPRILIADNGSGMDKNILEEAMKLGSATQKDELSDLGKYGMGLITASISISKKLEVITRQVDGVLLYSCQDLDYVIEKNDFEIENREATKEEKLLFEEYLKTGSGTLILLSKIDRLTTNASQFSDKLSKDIGRIYRKFIQSGIKISVNDKQVDPVDPLMLGEKDTRVYADDEYEIPSWNGKEKVHIKIVLLPEVNSQLEREMKMNIQSQGFYVLRNNREIANGEALGVFAKHNSLNRVRIELSFTSRLDNEMGVRFTKDGISPNQAISDFLKQEVGGQIASIKKMIEKTMKADDVKQVNHEDSEAVIAKKSKLLITPDAIIERREPKSHLGERKGSHPSEVKDRNPKKTHLSSSGLGARFETLSMGVGGSLYECSQEGKIIVIQWNVDHPFYEQVVLPRKDDKDLRAAIDFLIYAFASAELKTVKEENIVMMNSIKSIMSSNLRSLLL